MRRERSVDCTQHGLKKVREQTDHTEVNNINDGRACGKMGIAF